MWNSYKSLVFRGNTVDSPTAGTPTEVEIGVWGINPDFKEEGQTRLFAGGRQRSDVKRRYSFTVYAKPFKVLSQAADGVYQDFGTLWALKQLSAMPYTFLYRAYSASGTATLPRAGTSGTNSFWNLTTDTPAGILPLAIVFPEGVPHDVKHAAGTATCTFTIEGRERVSL